MTFGNENCMHIKNITVLLHDYPLYLSQCHFFLLTSALYLANNQTESETQAYSLGLPNWKSICVVAVTDAISSPPIYPPRSLQLLAAKQIDISTL